jgi:hypothetical protein
MIMGGPLTFSNICDHCTFLQALPPLGREAITAADLIYGAVQPTRLQRSDWLSGRGGCEVLLKRELDQARCARLIPS